MTDRELMQMADRIEVLAFEMKAPNAYTPQFVMLAYEIREALRARLAQPEPEPVAHYVIAGALFDFMGWLTSRKERIVLSSADNASPAVEVITEFAKMRGLSLDDAKVQDWNTAPPQREWQGLTDDEIRKQYRDSWSLNMMHDFARAIEAKLKEKNT